MWGYTVLKRSGDRRPQHRIERQKNHSRANARSAWNNKCQGAAGAIRISDEKHSMNAA
jgi:hypothetical protein